MTRSLLRLERDIVQWVQANSMGKYKIRVTAETPLEDYPWREMLEDKRIKSDYSPDHYAALIVLAKEFALTEEERLATGMTLAKEQWRLFQLALDSGFHVLAHGRPGTGKSRSAFEKAKETERRLDVINMRPNLPVDPLIGHYIPNKDGYFTWMNGVITAAMKGMKDVKEKIDKAQASGGLLLVNEIDHATGDAESLMHFALDDPSVASITLPNEEREIVRPLPGYQVVATMNGVASQDLSGPIYSRFGCKVRIDFPNPKAVALLDEDLRHVAMADYRNASAGRMIPDLRMLFNFQHLRKEMSQKDAAALVFETQGSEFLSAITKAA